MSTEMIDFDEIQTFNPRLPVGVHKLRLTEVDITQSQNGNDRLSAVFEALEGDFQGQEFTFHYYFTTFTDKKSGKQRCMGTEQIKQEMERVGAKTQGVKIKSYLELKRLYQKTFGGKKLKVAIVETVSKTKKKDDGSPQVYRNHLISGVVSDAPRAAAAAVEDDDEE